jgi:mannose-6-phosphate isomerase-like protein (cupin superfamily)
MSTKKIFYYTFSFIIIFAAVSYSQEKQANEKKPDTAKVKYTIDNCINTFNINKIDSTKAGYQYWFADKNFAEGKTVKLSVVKPHSATHAPHIHLEDEFYFILEGTAEVFLAGIWKTIQPYSSFYCPSNIEHGIRNPGDKELKYLVIKKYENK